MALKKYEFTINDSENFEIIITNQSKFFSEISKAKIELILLKENSSNVEKIYNSYVEELGTESGVEGVVV